MDNRPIGVFDSGLGGLTGLLVDRGVALLLGTLERGAVARHETVPFTLAVRESTSHPPRKDGTNS